MANIRMKIRNFSPNIPFLQSFISARANFAQWRSQKFIPRRRCISVTFLEKFLDRWNNRQLRYYQIFFKKLWISSFQMINLICFQMLLITLLIFVCIQYTTEAGKLFLILIFIVTYWTVTRTLGLLQHSCKKYILSGLLLV